MKSLINGGTLLLCIITYSQSIQLNTSQGRPPGNNDLQTTSLLQLSSQIQKSSIIEKYGSLEEPVSDDLNELSDTSILEFAENLNGDEGYSK